MLGILWRCSYNYVIDVLDIRRIVAILLAQVNYLDTVHGALFSQVVHLFTEGVHIRTEQTLVVGVYGQLE